MITSNAPSRTLHRAFHTLLGQGSLSKTEASDAFTQLFEPDVPVELKAAFLTALQMRGETPEELEGFLETVSGMIRKIDTPAPCADCVGTGSDDAGTFNISTASAILASACGVRMAKHGNRSASSPCGSADVVEALGIARPQTPEAVLKSLENDNFAFIHAPHFNMGFARIAGLRKTLGMRTLFNLFGPLLNPAFPEFRLIGVYSPARMQAAGEILRLMGTRNAMIVCSEDGLDEISIAAPTPVLHLENGLFKRYTVTPEEAGLKRSPLSEIRSGTALENAQTIRDVLSGKDRGAKRDTVLLNTAAVLKVAGKAETLRDGVELIARTIDSGAAIAQLQLITGKKEV